MPAYENVHRDLVGIVRDTSAYVNQEVVIEFSRPNSSKVVKTYRFKGKEVLWGGFVAGTLSDGHEALLTPRFDLPGRFVLFVSLSRPAAVLSSKTSALASAI